MALKSVQQLDGQTDNQTQMHGLQSLIMIDMPSLCNWDAKFVILYAVEYSKRMGMTKPMGMQPLNFDFYNLYKLCYHARFFTATDSTKSE